MSRICSAELSLQAVLRSIYDRRLQLRQSRRQGRGEASQAQDKPIKDTQAKDSQGGAEAGAAAVMAKASSGGKSSSDLTKEEIEEYREAFKLFDKDGNKSISRQELVIVMRSLGRNPTDKDIDAMMADADADVLLTQKMNTIRNVSRFKKESVRPPDKSTNEISFGEFLTVMETRHNDDPDEEMREAFRVFDRDGDGFISAAELKSTMKSLGEDLTEPDLQNMIDEADTNGDGKVDLKEFVSMMNKR